MRRTASLVAVAVAVLSILAAAALAAGRVPRGTLTNVEYHEFLAVQKVQKEKPKTRNLASIAKLECKPLTRVSRLTSTQHAECVAEFFFFPRLYEFIGRLAHCEKNAARSAALRCIERTTDAMYRATRNFNATNAASLRAAQARGFAGRWLDYLVFTPRQAQAMRTLASALGGFRRALRARNPVAVSTFGKQLTADLAATLRAFGGTGSVSVCRHQ